MRKRWKPKHSAAMKERREISRARYIAHVCVGCELRTEYAPLEGCPRCGYRLPRCPDCLLRLMGGCSNCPVRSSLITVLWARWAVLAGQRAEQLESERLERERLEREQDEMTEAVSQAWWGEREEEAP